MFQRRRIVPLALVSFAAALIALHPVADSDTFWHLTLGRAVVHAHARIVAEPSAFAAFSPTVIAAEWLWEAIAYALYHAGGFALLAWWLAAMAAAAAVTTWMLAHAARAADSSNNADGKRPAGWGAPLLVTTMALMTLDSRMVLRPQSAYLVLLPLFVALVLRLLSATGKRRLQLALLLVAIELLWAQLHGSFILGPLVFVAAAAADPSVRDAGARRAYLLTLLALSLAALTSAQGPSIAVYVLEHSGGDAVRHIADMRAPSWQELDPISPYAAGFWALTLLALVGLVAARRIWWSGLALMLLGLVLLATAVRFVDASVILTLPLALRGADALVAQLPSWRGWKWLSAAASAALLLWLGLLARGWWGPTGQAALDESRVPVVAAAWLGQAPPTNVLSTYEVDAPLAFYLAGHDRTFVDGRTPLYFDATDYAVAREVWSDTHALERALRRYDVGAVVAPRDSELCTSMASRWQPVAIESGFTTFVPAAAVTTTATATATALSHLNVCGEELLPRRACDDAAATRAELERMSALHAGPLWTILTADLAARCRGEILPLPSLRAAWPYEKEWRRAAARIAIAQSRAGDALELLQPLVDNGDLVALSILRPAFNALPLPALRAHLETALRTLDDAAPPELRADLALVCSVDGDSECVRFNALRAAARGVPSARAPLEWLAAHHPSPRVQDDARAWLATLPPALP